jgi:predicted Zn-dependent peptidase
VRVAIVPLPAVHQTVLTAHITVGSRFERPADNGLSHFLEHMLFRGTPRLPSADAQALAFDDLGCSLEASTSADCGTLSVSGPPESFYDVVPLFGEVFQSPIFDAIEVERGIVREEILEDLDERGRLVDPDALLAAVAFDGHPLGQPVTGTLKHIERFDREALDAHHARHYNGASTVIAVAGPVDPGAVLAALEDAFGGVAPGAPPSQAPPPLPAGPRFRHIRHADSQTRLRVGFLGPGATDRDEVIVQLVLRLLDDGMSTRLYRRLCEERGLCYDVSAEYAAFQDAGLLSVAADSAHEHAPEVLSELLGVIRRLREEGPQPGELARAQRRYVWGLRELLDDAGGMAEYHALQLWLDRAASLSDRATRIQSVTEADVRRVCARLFAPEALAVVAVGDGSRPRRAALEALALEYR